MSKEVASEAAFEANLVAIRDLSNQLHGEVFAPYPEAVQTFRESDAGWQTRMDAALKDWLMTYKVA